MDNLPQTAEPESSYPSPFVGHSGCSRLFAAANHIVMTVPACGIIFVKQIIRTGGGMIKEMFASQFVFLS